MGFTLNGNTGLVVLAILATVLIIAITIIAVTGSQLPGVLPDSLIALVAAAGGGGVIHRLQYQDKRDLTSTVTDAIERVAGEPAPQSPGEP